MGKLFGTDGIRGIANEKLTARLAFDLGKAFAIFLSKTALFKRVVIGRDTRYSGQMFCFAFVSGLNSMGFSAILTGVVPSPALAFFAKTLEVDGGVMITASHNPAEFNGFKFYDANGYKIAPDFQDEIEKIYTEIDSYRGCDAIEIGGVVESDLLKLWVDDVVKTVENPNFDGYKIALDTANGATFAVAPYIFKMLGAITVTLNNSDDGTLINKNCGSAHIENFASECVANGVDFGFSFDGDGDRVVVVCRNGEVLDGADLMYIFANYLHEKGKLNKDKIVSTLITNCGLEDSLKRRGIEMFRVDVGSGNVQRCMKENDLNFGAEESGHILLNDGEACGITAALMFLKIVKETGMSVAELLEGFERSCVVKSDIVVSERQKSAVENNQLDDLVMELENELGSFGRIVLRTSGTESIVRVLVEGKEPELLESINEKLSKAVQNI